MALHARQYDIVVFGATGYTGQYCVEHITTHLPSNLSWAVAGRSHEKLSAAVQALKKLNSDRKQPGECLYARNWSCIWLIQTAICQLSR